MRCECSHGRSRRVDRSRNRGRCIGLQAEEQLEHPEFGLPRRFHSSWQYDPPQFLLAELHCLRGSLGIGALGDWSWVCGGVFSWRVRMSFVLVLVVLVLVLVPLLVLLLVVTYSY